MSEAPHAPTGADDAIQHYDREGIDAETFKAATALLHRATSAAPQRARADIQWADEVIAVRDPGGALAGVHGFKYVDVDEGSGQRKRLIYVVFSATKGGAEARTLSRNVGARVHGRERRLHAGATLVWATSPNAEVDEALPTGGMQKVQRLLAPPARHFSAKVRIFTEHAGGAAQGPSETISAGLGDALAELMREHQDFQAHALTRRALPANLWQKVAAGVSAAAAAAAALFFVVRPGGDDPGGLGIKGAAALHVYRQVGEGSEEVLSGGPFAAGDRLRFTVDLPAAGTVAVVGVEADGDLYTAWPPAGADAHRVWPAGKGHALEGAVTLDTSPGRETLYVVHCPGATAGPVCQGAGATAPPQCPAGCALGPFVVDKTDAPAR